MADNAVSNQSQRLTSKVNKSLFVSKFSSFDQVLVGQEINLFRSF